MSESVRKNARYIEDKGVVISIIIHLISSGQESVKRHSTLDYYESELINNKTNSSIKI